MVFTSKDSLIKALKGQLATNEKRAIEGLLRIYSFAEQYITQGWLSPKQIICVKKNMPKYDRRLINLLITNGKIVKENGEYVFVR